MDLSPLLVIRRPPRPCLNQEESDKWINEHFGWESSLDTMKTCLSPLGVRPRDSDSQSVTECVDKGKCVCRWPWRREFQILLVILRVVNPWMVTEMCIVTGRTKVIFHFLLHIIHYCTQTSGRLLLKPLFSIFYCYSFNTDLAPYPSQYCYSTEGFSDIINHRKRT